MNSNEVTLPEAQQMVDQWIKTNGVRYFSELTNLAILTEEVGEAGANYGTDIRRSVVQKIGRRKRHGRRNGRCALGFNLSGQPNRS